MPAIVIFIDAVPYHDTLPRAAWRSWCAIAAASTLFVLASPAAAQRVQGSTQGIPLVPRALPPVTLSPAPSPFPSTSTAPSAPRAASWLLTSAMSSAVLYGTTLPNNEQPARWQSGNSFDDAVRNAFVLSDDRARDRAASVSDGLLGGLALAPLVIDALLLAWIVEDDPELAIQMMLVNMQAHAIAQGLTALLKHAVARERPISRACREGQGGPGCREEVAPESFFSGHASLAFTSAALICYHHEQNGFLGEAGDAAMCATGLALAAATSLLRVMSDRHYMSDVLIGAAVGLLTGYLVPQFLSVDIFDDNAGVSATVGPMVDGEQYGVQIFGIF